MSLPLPSPLRANHFCGLFWDPFHFCNSLGHAEQKGQITPLQNAIVLASLFPALVCTSPSFARPSCLWAKQKEHVLFCFISLPVLAHGQIVSQLPTVLVPSTSPHNGHKFSGGPDPQALCFLQELSQHWQWHYPQTGFCVKGSAGLLAQMHGRNSS